MKNAIIDQLKVAEGYLSGEAISKTLSISRAAIWKNIEELRKDGYEIEALPHNGYRLSGVPDKMLAREIQDGIGTKILGKDIEHFESVDSTMNIALERAQKGAVEGTVIISETQLKGRGRMGRVWSSPKGKGIYASIILRPKLAIVDVAKLNLMMAVAIREAVFSVCSIDAGIKWPNDLLINKKKVTGLLTEMSAEMDRLNFIVAGIGLNVNASRRQMVDGATSLKAECGREISRVHLFQEILRRIEFWYTQVSQNGFEKLIKSWKEHSVTIGSRVKLVDPSGEVKGLAIGLDEYGGLMIQNDQGVVIKRMSGDIIQN